MHVAAVLPQRVSPFGNLRIDAYVPLPEAYRSLSRPSSAPDAKAFPLRSDLLDLLHHSCFSNYAGIHFGSLEIVIVLPFFRKVSTILVFRFASLLPCFFFFSLFSFQGTKFRGHSPGGGDKRNRTADPLLAKQVLSQLSYTPISSHSRVEN